MDSAPAPKAIVVIFYNYRAASEGYEEIIGKARTKCLVHTSEIPDVSRSLFGYVFKRSGPYESQLKEAHQFVVKNYRHGDHVMILGWLRHETIGSPRYNAILQLTTALDTGGPISASGSALANEKIPIKCVYLLLTSGTKRLEWAELNQMLSDFPCAIENIFCLGDYNAYAIQRGSSGQIIRKEAWLGISNIWYARLDWLVLQTNHIMNYDSRDLIKSSNPSGLARGISQPRLLHTMMHLNCTKRQLGLPCDDAIPTGGQLIRVSEVMWDTYRYVVWSSQSFRQDEHEHVSSMPLVGPRSL